MDLPSDFSVGLTKRVHEAVDMSGTNPAAFKMFYVSSVSMVQCRNEIMMSYTIYNKKTDISLLTSPSSRLRGRITIRLTSSGAQNGP